METKRIETGGGNYLIQVNDNNRSYRLGKRRWLLRKLRWQYQSIIRFIWIL